MDTPITEQVVRDALEASEFVVARAAKRLGVSRQALYRLMRKHAIIVTRYVAA
jgi:transcriptional regulator of acetoin/glycerol metabolism